MESSTWAPGNGSFMANGMGNGPSASFSRRWAIERWRWHLGAILVYIYQRSEDDTYEIGGVHVIVEDPVSVRLEPGRHDPGRERATAPHADGYSPDTFAHGCPSDELVARQLGLRRATHAGTARKVVHEFTQHAPDVASAPRPGPSRTPGRQSSAAHCSDPRAERGAPH